MATIIVLPIIPVVMTLGYAGLCLIRDARNRVLFFGPGAGELNSQNPDEVLSVVASDCRIGEAHSTIWHWI